MMTSFLTGFSYGLAFGVVVWIALNIVRHVRGIPDGLE